MLHKKELYSVFPGLTVPGIQKTKPKQNQQQKTKQEIHGLEIKLLDTTEGTGSLNKKFYPDVFLSQTGLEELSKKNSSYLDANITKLGVKNQF